MRLAIVLLLGAQLWGSELLSFRRQSNVFALKLSDGGGEVEWISPSSFRFARFWGPAKVRLRPIKQEAIKVTAEESKSHLQFSTRHLKVEVEKSGLRFRVKTTDGPVMEDAAEIRRENDGIVIERDAPAKERYYGLGPRIAASVDLRGQRIRAAKPFMISSLGYGEYHAAPGTYIYDLAGLRPDRRRITIEGGNRVEFFFYYGPTPKEILEEHAAVAGRIQSPDSSKFAILAADQVPKAATVLSAPGEGAWTTLRDSIRSMAHLSMSAMLLPAFDLSPYQSGDGALLERAAQLGGVAPILFASKAGLGRLRKSPVYQKTAETRERLTPFLLAYAQEAREQGLPFIRPLAMMFPNDEQGVREIDEFMLGDELLIAPVCAPEGQQTVYLPRGIWTDLRTNQVYKGRQSIEVRAAADELPMFARNGGILPLASLEESGPLALHYFPKLAAEFFLLEEDIGEYSQVHASPAVDFLRLEIESMAARTYEWVVHHTGPCGRVAAVGGPEYALVKRPGELKPGAWFYDQARNNLHIRTSVAAKENQIVNVYLCQGF